MRKLAILGGVILALVAVTPVFAAGSTHTGSQHQTAAPVHTWRASASQGKTNASSRLSVNASATGGTFTVSVKGAAPKSAATSALVIGPCGGKGDSTVTTFVRTTSANGAAAGTAKLTKAQAAQVEAAIKAGKKLSVDVTDGSMRMCGAFSG